jgi:dTDP-4-amino-4,6-dideoxygalactose transaminase
VNSSHFSFVTSVKSPYVAHLAVVRSGQRDGLRAHLAAAGIKTEVHYPIPDHLQAGFKLFPPPSLPVTEESSAEILSIPLFPELRTDEIERICGALTDFSVIQ